MPSRVQGPIRCSYAPQFGDSDDHFDAASRPKPQKSSPRVMYGGAGGGRKGFAWAVVLVVAAMAVVVRNGSHASRLSASATSLTHPEALDTQPHTRQNKGKLPPPWALSGPSSSSPRRSSASWCWRWPSGSATSRRECVFLGEHDIHTHDPHHTDTHAQPFSTRLRSPHAWHRPHTHHFLLSTHSCSPHLRPRSPPPPHSYHA